MRVRGSPWAPPAPKTTVVLRRTLIVFVIALIAAAPAYAGTIVVKLTFAPGKLSLRSPQAVDATRGAQVQLTIGDGRGSGAGWTLHASQAVTVSSITARCATNSTCTLPRPATSPSGTVVLTAARGTGMGIVELVVTLRPSAARAVTFSVS
jgi:hypothetical protein